MKTIQNKYLRPLLALAMGLAMTNAALANGLPPRILSPLVVNYDRSHGEWAAAWWQWCLSIPRATHPLFASGNVDASIGQTGPVWFLGGNFDVGTTGPVVRNVTVPGGKALFFPLINYEDSEVEETVAYGNPGTTINTLRAIVEPAIDEAADSSKLRLDIDGYQVRNLDIHRLRSPAFSYTLPADNIWSAVYGVPFSAGTYNAAIDDGIYVMLAPLSRGRHVIHFHAEIPSFGFVVDITYNITVTN